MTYSKYMIQSENSGMKPAMEVISALIADQS